MIAHDTLALVRHYYEQALSQADWDALDRLVAPDLVEHEVVPGIPPTRAGLKQKYNLLRGGCPDLRFAVEEVFGAGPRVAARVTVTGTNTQPFMGRPPSGRTFAATTISIFRIAGGRIAEHWGVFDQLAMIAQLGLMASQAPQEAHR